MRILHPPLRRRASHGLTLIEVMIGLAIAVVLMSLALPSIFSSLQRQRLRGAAESLSMDLTEGRFEAARRGLPVHVRFVPGVDWCYALATTPDCDCHVRQACLIKAVRAKDWRSVQLIEGRPAVFTPDNGAASGNGMALLQSTGGDRLRVELSGMGRARVCAPDGGMPQFHAC